MNLSYWVDFIIVCILGVILVQISHGKILTTKKLNINLSSGFLKVIRYMGLFIIVYKSYSVMIDYAIG